MPERPKYTPPTEESENPREYERSDSQHYSEKKNHRERTLANEEAEGRKHGHKEWWKKKKKNENN